MMLGSHSAVLLVRTLYAYQCLATAHTTEDGVCFPTCNTKEIGLLHQCKTGKDAVRPDFLACGRSVTPHRLMRQAQGCSKDILPG